MTNAVRTRILTVWIMARSTKRDRGYGMKTYEYGVALLKIIMSFEVILCHYWTEHGDLQFYLIPFANAQPLAVPIFMLVSFYLCERFFNEFSKVNLKKRMWRLIYPFWIWGGVYFLFYKTFQLINKVNPVSVKDLLWQLILGCSPVLNPPLWFQADLIIITTIYYLILTLFPRKEGLICIWILAAAALIMQYSGMNENLFRRFQYEIRYTVGRIAEMLPYATIGYFISTTELIDKLKKNRIGSSIGIIFLYIISTNTLNDHTSGFGYGGMRYIVMGTLIFLLVMLIPYEKVPQCIKKMIECQCRVFKK